MSIIFSVTLRFISDSEKDLFRFVKLKTKKSKSGREKKGGNEIFIYRTYRSLVQFIIRINKITSYLKYKIGKWFVPSCEKKKKMCLAASRSVSIFVNDV